MAKIEIFSGPGCAHCQMAKDLLNANQLAFSEIDISKPENLEEFSRRLPRARSIPQIFIDDEHIGNETDLKLKLERGEI